MAKVRCTSSALVGTITLCTKEMQLEQYLSGQGAASTARFNAARVVEEEEEDEVREAKNVTATYDDIKGGTDSGSD